MDASVKPLPYRDLELKEIKQSFETLRLITSNKLRSCLSHPLINKTQATLRSRKSII